MIEISSSNAFRLFFFYARDAVHKHRKQSRREGESHKRHDEREDVLNHGHRPCRRLRAEEHARRPAHRKHVPALHRRR